MDRRHKHKGALVAAAVAAPALLLAACGGSSGGSSGAAGSGSGSSSNAQVATQTSGSATYLADAAGRSLYLFEGDHGPRSSCGSGCDTVWPPLTTTGRPHSMPGAHAGMLGMTPRSDGTQQVTYAGHPLYYYSGDSGPQQTNGEGLDDFGAEWYLVSPGGTNVEHVGGSSTGSTSTPSGSGSGSSGGGW